jgi:hypothetical protein
MEKPRGLKTSDVEPARSGIRPPVPGWKRVCRVSHRRTMRSGEGGDAAVARTTIALPLRMLTQE